MFDPKKFFSNKKVFIVVLVLVVLVVAFQNFTSNSGLLNLSYGGVQQSGDYDMKVTSESSRGYTGIAPNTPPASTGSIDVSDRKVIKNASLSIIVKNINDTIRSVKTVASEVGGFVQNMVVSENGGVMPYRTEQTEDLIKSGYIVIRVPSDKLDSALERIKAEAIKVSSENVTNQDVTEQFVDLEAQLRNTQREEQSYLAVLDRATKVEDILNISSRLSDVRGRIERLQGQINYLSRSIDMSTITVNLTSEADVEVFGVVWSPLVVIKEAIRNLLEQLVGYINALIRIIFSLPVLALWLATIGAGLYLIFKFIEFLKKVLLK